MKIAVIGAGIAGIGSGWLLSPENTVDVYEADASASAATHARST